MSAGHSYHTEEGGMSSEQLACTQQNIGVRSVYGVCKECVRSVYGVCWDKVLRKQCCRHRWGHTRWCHLDVEPCVVSTMPGYRRDIKPASNGYKQVFSKKQVWGASNHLQPPPTTSNHLAPASPFIPSKPHPLACPSSPYTYFSSTSADCCPRTEDPSQSTPTHHEMPC